MTVETRVCPPDRFGELLRAAEVAFSEDVSDAKVGLVEGVADKERFLAAMDGDRIVGTAGVFTLCLQLPGGEAPMGGVTWVTVMPSHRRQGVMSSMMRLMIDDCHRRGELLAGLWAAEGAIYGRFGFGIASLYVGVQAEMGAVGMTSDAPRDGSFRLLPVGEGLDLVRSVYDAARRARPGFLARTPEWWKGILPRPDKDTKGGEAKRLVVFETADGPEAYAVYKTKAQWNEQGPGGTVTVDEAIGSTAKGTREIWRYLFGLDLMRTLKAGRLPEDHPVLLMAAEPRRLGLVMGDGLWLRILDVAAALEARTYGVSGYGHGRLAFDLADDYCPWNAGRWQLDVDDGRAGVKRTDSTADIGLSAAELASMLLGTFSATSLAAAGRVRELRPGGLAAADELFATATRPWCPQEF